MRRQAALLSLVEQRDVVLEEDDIIDEEEAQIQVRTQLIETFKLSNYDAQMEKLFQKDGRCVS